MKSASTMMRAARHDMVSTCKLLWLVPIICLMMVSCGTASKPDGTGSNPFLGPIPMPVLPTVLHVFRPAINQYPSLDRTIQNAKAVQQLYRAAYTQPVPPAGRENCPLDNGIIYYLTFLHGTPPLQQMTLQAAGCQFLRLNQQTNEVRLTTEAFRSFFLKTVGIPSLVPGVP